MDKAYLKARFPLLMLVFAFGGIFGFIYEEIFYRFDLGEWVKRGTTFGPWIPIYGFGGLIILAPLGLPFRDDRVGRARARNRLGVPHFLQRKTLGL